ncbi:hypothetical protein KVV02_005446 [Mortierella alpina]|uniref:Uncharacterized protein n=1 Tax=Mortierella alpina TaxID=64518 RepID=A0A9P7ZZQ6_MORAP|nr:hypothetical protein KVV02_005446 [Mortierella alpina]
MPHANTEKVIFTARHAAESHSSPTGGSVTDAVGYHGILDLTLWKTLTSPHTIIQAEMVRPSFYENSETIAALKKRAASSKGAGQTSDLIREATEGGIDLQNREFKWYVLPDLDDGASFELRISYPATSPADFEIMVWTLSEAQEHLPKHIRLLDHFSKNTMFARIKAVYTGISYLSTGDSATHSPETLPVPYNLVLERLYFMIPYQALKLAAVIIIVVIVGLGYLVPTIHSALLDVASGAGETILDGKKAQ